jgi:hypothetical protein
MKWGGRGRQRQKQADCPSRDVGMRRGSGGGAGCGKTRRGTKRGGWPSASAMETHSNSGGPQRRGMAGTGSTSCWLVSSIWYGKRASRESQARRSIEARSVSCLTRYSACRGYGALRISKAGDGDETGPLRGWPLETGRGLERAGRRRINRLQETLSSACPRTGTQMVMEDGDGRRATSSSVVAAAEVEKEKVGSPGGKGDRDSESGTQNAAQHSTALSTGQSGLTGGRRLDGEGRAVGARIRRTANPQGGAGAGCGPCTSAAFQRMPPLVSILGRVLFIPSLPAGLTPSPSLHD